MSAQNVSLAHLLYEARLIEGRDIGGNAYAVTDPGPPIRYTDLYRAMNVLAHPRTPQSQPPVPPVPLILFSHLMEIYITLQRRPGFSSFLPPVTSYDLTMLQPAMFNYSTQYILYDYERARKDLGYNPTHGTLEGVCLHLLEWNEKVERKIREEGKVVDESSLLEKTVPVAS